MHLTTNDFIEQKNQSLHYSLLFKIDLYQNIKFMIIKLVILYNKKNTILLSFKYFFV